MNQTKRIIQCTGDARKGDIVLFKQYVCVGGTKPQMKKRIVAGKIVREAQCDSEDKHIFVVSQIKIVGNQNFRDFAIINSHSNLFMLPFLF